MFNFSDYLCFGCMDFYVWQSVVVTGYYDLLFQSFYKMK